MRDNQAIANEMFTTLRQSGSPLSDFTPQGVTYTLLRSFASSLQQLELLQEQQFVEVDITTAKGAALDSYCRPFGVYRQPENPAAGWLLVASNENTQLLNGSVFTEITAGTQYLLNSSTTIQLTAQVEQAVPVIAAGLGNQYDLSAGTLLYSNQSSIVSAVVGYERKYDGSACGDLTGGQLAESDSSLRQRWYSLLRAGGLLTNQTLRTLVIQHPQVAEATVTTPQPGIVLVVVKAISSTPELVIDLENLIRPYLIAAIVVVRLAQVQPLTVDITLTPLSSADLNQVKTDVEAAVLVYFRQARAQRYFAPADLQQQLTSLGKSVLVTNPVSPLSWNELSFIELGGLNVNFRL
jgi:Baseplate J-like protein